MFSRKTIITNGAAYSLFCKFNLFLVKPSMLNYIKKLLFIDGLKLYLTITFRAFTFHFYQLKYTKLPKKPGV